MAAVNVRAPTYLQPRPKANATSNISPQSVPASNGLERPSTPVSRSSSRQSPSDILSDKVTAALIRRTLCRKSADKTAEIPDLLPPLTSRNDVDLQLYALIAIIIKDFVAVWYSKITPDEDFVDEIVHIIAHCTRAVEQRLRKVDLEAVIFDELPELLDTHVRAFRIAYCRIYLPPTTLESRVTYHALRPTPALAPVPNEASSSARQAENERQYRQLLVQSTLAVLLPPEDLKNGCLTSLVGQIISELIINNGLGGKACEPWLLWEAITKIADLVGALKSKSIVGEESSEINTTPVPTEANSKVTLGRNWGFAWPQRLLWLISQYAFFTYVVIRFLVISLASSSSLPRRNAADAKGFMAASQLQHNRSPNSDTNNPRAPLDDPKKVPILDMHIWSCAGHLLDLDFRMPWLCATLSLLQWASLQGPGALGRTDGIIDKLLSQAIHQYILDAKLLPVLLRAVRGALFPFNAPGPARVVPNAEEQLRIRKTCAVSILRLIPDKVRDIYWGPDAARQVDEVEQVLNVFGDSYANKHLIYAMLELFLVRLMPELAEKGLTELLEERLS